MYVRCELGKSHDILESSKKRVLSMLGSRIIKFQESKCLIASRMNAEYTELA